MRPPLTECYREGNERMDMSGMEHLPQAANQDPEFRIHAKTL